MGLDKSILHGPFETKESKIQPDILTCSSAVLSCEKGLFWESTPGICQAVGTRASSLMKFFLIQDG